MTAQCCQMALTSVWMRSASAHLRPGQVLSHESGVFTRYRLRPVNGRSDNSVMKWAFILWHIDYMMILEYSFVWLINWNDISVYNTYFIIIFSKIVMHWISITWVLIISRHNRYPAFVQVIMKLAANTSKCTCVAIYLEPQYTTGKI